MALDELFQAMNMFKQGVNELAASKGINQAHQQVQDLKAQQLDEVKERQGLSAIAQNLTMNLAAVGAPLGQMQAAVGAVAPPVIKSANDAYIQGMMAGPEKGGALAELGKTAMIQENAPKERIANIEGQYKMKAAELTSERSAGRLEDKQQQALDKAFQEAGSRVNQFKGRGGGELQKYQAKIASADRIDGLLNKRNNLDPRETEELALSMQNLLSNSNVTSTEIVKQLVPNTGEGAFQKNVEYWTNKRKELNNQDFVDQMKKTVDREREVAGQQLKKGQYQSLAGMTDQLQRDPERWKNFLKQSRLSPEEYQMYQDTNSVLPYSQTHGATIQGAVPPQKSPGGLPSGLPAGSFLTTVKDKNGTVMQVYKTPDGKFFKAD